MCSNVLLSPPAHRPAPSGGCSAAERDGDHHDGRDGRAPCYEPQRWKASGSPLPGQTEPRETNGGEHDQASRSRAIAVIDRNVAKPGDCYVHRDRPLNGGSDERDDILVEPAQRADALIARRMKPAGTSTPSGVRAGRIRTRGDLPPHLLLGLGDGRRLRQGAVVPSRSSLPWGGARRPRAHIARDPARRLARSIRGLEASWCPRRPTFHRGLGALME